MHIDSHFHVQHGWSLIHSTNARFLAKGRHYSEFGSKYRGPARREMMYAIRNELLDIMKTLLAPSNREMRRTCPNPDAIGDFFYELHAVLSR